MQKTKESDAPDGEWPRIERAARSHLAAHGKRHVVPASADIHAALITELSRYAPPGMPGTDEFNAREDAIRGLCQQNGENDELMDQISCMLQESDPKFVAVRGNPYHHCERGIPPPLPRSQPSGHGATKSSGGGKQNIGGGVPRCPGASALRLLKTARSTFRYVARSCYGAHKQYLPLHFFWPKARVRFFEILFPLAGDKRDVFVDALKAGPNIYRCIPARRLVETFLSPSISFAYFFWDYNRLEKQRTDILLIDNMPWLVYYNVYSAHTQKGFQKISGSFSPPWSPPPIADFFGAEVASLVAKSSHRDDNCAFMALMLQVIEGLDLVHQDVPGEYPQPKEFQSCAPGTQVCLWEKKPSERFVDEIYLGKTVEEEWTCIGAHTRVLVPNADGAISTRAAKDLRVGDRVIVGGGTAGGEGGWRKRSARITAMTRQFTSLSTELCVLAGDILVTPFHPVRTVKKFKSDGSAHREKRWRLPHEIVKTQSRSDLPPENRASAVELINFVLGNAMDCFPAYSVIAQGKRVDVDVRGCRHFVECFVECVTLGHGLKEEGVAHAFWGTEKVVDALRGRSDWPNCRLGPEGLSKELHECIL